MLWTVLAALCAIALAQVLSAVVKAQRYRHVPGYFGIAFWKWSLVLPVHARWGFVDTSVWADQGKAYKLFGLKGYVIRSLWSGRSSLILSDVEGVKQVTSSPQVWVKSEVLCELFSYFGASLATSEGIQYKRHKKIAGPAFGEGFSRSMWDGAINVVDDYIERLSAQAGQGQAIMSTSDSSQLALMIIGQAGFGLKFDWPTEQDGESGQDSLAFRDTLRETLKLLFVKSGTPQWIWKLPLPSIRRVNTIFDTFESQVFALVKQRREDERQGAQHNDLLSRLIAASDSESGPAQLDRPELLSNIHLFMVAGHVTTALAVMGTLMFLALHPEHQAPIAREARRALATASAEDKPDYGAFANLKLTTGAFLESLRLYPRVLTVIKVAATDTSLVAHTVPTKPGERGAPVQIPVAKGTTLAIDVPAMSLDTESWGEDATTFRPSRFVDTDDYKWPRDAFVGFSSGLRGCIGRQAAIVARLLAKYRIEPPAERADEWKLREGESEHQRRQRVWDPYFNGLLIAFPPLDVALVPRE